MQVTQQLPKLVTYTLAELLELPSTLNGEQFPLNEKSVASLVEDIYDNGLVQPLEVTKLDDYAILSGGRHRREALAQLYSDTDPSTVTLTVLEYAVQTPDELVQRVITSNGSRRMVGAEKKELVTSAKFGFDTMDVDSLTSKVYTLEDASSKLDLITLILAIHLNETYDMGKNTALVLARSLVTKVKALKFTQDIDAKVDEDGTVLAPASKRKVSYFCDDMFEDTIFSIVQSVGYFETMPVEMPIAVYEATLATGLGIVGSVDIPEGMNVANVSVTVQRPTALQRYAAKYVRALMCGVASYLKETNAQ